MLNQLQNVFKCLKKHKVKYLTIGGIAAIIYGVPRATFDLDILIDTSPDNVQNLLNAFIDAGLETANLTSVKKVIDNEITVFKDYVRIDVQSFTPGIEFKKAWQNKKVMHYKASEFYLISKEDLILSKKASGKKIDLEDEELLALENKNRTDK